MHIRGQDGASEYDRMQLELPRMQKEEEGLLPSRERWSTEHMPGLAEGT